MSEVKFTKGPWIANEGSSRETEITAGSREGKVPVCEMDVYYGGIIGVEQQANAHLIAAAPELYEALGTALRLLEIAGLDDRIGYVEGEKALAKARGEQ